MEDSKNLISRQAAIDALAENMPSAYTPDGSHPADEGIFMAQEIYADCIQTLKELPSAQPENVPSRKGVFIPDITVEMFRNASLEGIEDLLASGEMEDISLPSAQPEIEERKEESAQNVPNDELISKKAVIDAIFSEPLYETGMKKRDADAVVPAIYEKIKSLPSAQPEIVRCEDCVRFDKRRGCNLVEGLNIAKTDSFCSYAERKEGEADG